MPTQITNQKDFVKIFQSLCHTQSAWKVWNDFVEALALSLANGVIQDPEREQQYIDIMNRYSAEDQMKFPELGVLLCDSLDRNPRQDFLGQMFMTLELGSNWHGQFFTPYNVCEAMTEVVIDHKEQKYVTAYDPACGAGATLIAARNVLERQGKGSLDAFFIGQDLSRIAGMMCYVQLSLLGCAGYVCIANTLDNPTVGGLDPIKQPGQEFWFTPLWYHDLWQARIMKERYDDRQKAEGAAAE